MRYVGLLIVRGLVLSNAPWITRSTRCYRTACRPNGTHGIATAYIIGLWLMLENNIIKETEKRKITMSNGCSLNDMCHSAGRCRSCSANLKHGGSSWASRLTALCRSQFPTAVAYGRWRTVLVMYAVVLLSQFCLSVCLSDACIVTKN